jgi:hypothetical protein
MLGRGRKSLLKSAAKSVMFDLAIVHLLFDISNQSHPASS